MVHLPQLVPIVLVPGGLYDDPPMTGAEFWGASGVASAIARAGVEVVVHERPSTPRSWVEEAAALAETIDRSGHERVALVAGSNGCSAALRYVLDHPGRAARTMLCWPATAGDPVVDELARIIISDTHDADIAAGLLAGSPVRGVTPDELATLDHECVVYPSLPENKIHQRTTVIDLVEALPNAILVGGSPEPTDDAFADFLDTFTNVVAAFSRIEHDD